MGFLSLACSLPLMLAAGAPSPVLAGVELIPNGGFEAISDAGVPVGWKRFCDDVLPVDAAELQRLGNAANSTVSGGARTGDRCVSVNIAGGRKEIGGWSARVRVTPRTLYRLSFWAKVADAPAAFAKVDQFGADGRRSAHKPCGPLADRWQQYTLDFITRPETIGVQIVAGIWSGAGRAWFDDFSLRQMNALPAPEERPFPPVRDELGRDDLPQAITVFSRDYTEPVYPTGLPRASEVTNRFARSACPGEYEPVTFGIHARDSAVKVRLELTDDFVGGGQGRISRRHVEVRAVGFTCFWFGSSEYQRIPLFLDKLPLEPSAESIILRPVSIPRGESRRFWITVCVPESARAGTYRMPLRLHVSNGTSLPCSIELTVHPFRLRAPKIALGMYYNMRTLPPAKQTRDYQRLVFEDMAAHGMTSLAMMYLCPFRGSLELSVPPYVGVIPTMEDFVRAGFDPTIPIVVATNPLPKVLALMRERNWPEWICYGVDEPGHGGDRQIAAAKKIVTARKKNIPSIKQTTAFYHKKAIEELGALHDVWICHVTTLDEDILALAKTLRKEVWTYECILGPATPECPRLHYGLYTWALGLRGALTWVYQDGGASISNRMGQSLRELARSDSATPWAPAPSPWELYDAQRREEFAWRFDFTYPGAVGPEPTVGWEMLREGVDDYRYLSTLAHEAGAAAERAPSARSVAEAKALMARVRALVRLGVTFSGRPLGHYEFRYGWDFSPGIQVADYARIRREAAAAIEALRAPRGEPR